MNGFFLDGTASFAGALLACSALSWAVPLRRESFEVLMKGRIIRVFGRMVLVLVLVAGAVGPLGWNGPAVTVGVLSGWLVSSGWEAWRCRRAGDDGNDG